MLTEDDRAAVAARPADMGWKACSEDKMLVLSGATCFGW
jgi:hypothetical protein